MALTHRCWDPTKCHTCQQAAKRAKAAAPSNAVRAYAGEVWVSPSAEGHLAHVAGMPCKPAEAAKAQATPADWGRIVGIPDALARVWAGEELATTEGAELTTGRTPASKGRRKVDHSACIDCVKLLVAEAAV